MLDNCLWPNPGFIFSQEEIHCSLLYCSLITFTVLKQEQNKSPFLFPPLSLLHPKALAKDTTHFPFSFRFLSPVAKSKNGEGGVQKYPKGTKTHMAFALFRHVQMSVHAPLAAS